MDLYVIMFGVIFLVGLAVAAGLAGVTHQRSVTRAWRAIALERQRVWEERRRILESIERCRDCPYREGPR